MEFNLLTLSRFNFNTFCSVNKSFCLVRISFKSCINSIFFAFRDFIVFDLSVIVFDFFLSWSSTLPNCSESMLFSFSIFTTLLFNIALSLTYSFLRLSIRILRIVICSFLDCAIALILICRVKSSNKTFIIQI